MTRYARLWLAALLLALALALASCGMAGSGGSGDGGMQGMEHDGSGGPSGASEDATEDTQAAEETGGMAGMDHDSADERGEGGMASEMLMDDGQYSDERFIDSMIPHHRGAVDMAEVALHNAEHSEIERLAEDIVRTQEAEIEELRSIKQEEFGTSEVPEEVGSEEMEMMGMSDPEQLAGEGPFDRAFIDAMIPHHESAIEMAQVALDESPNAEIRRIAGAIVEAQEKEIAQMRGWREEWYPEG
jgi:uncharacterized protein (DUF305 family)